MEYILSGIGLVMFLFISLDILWTTLWVDGGAGPLTNWVTTLMRKLFQKTNRKGQMIKFTGPVILVSILSLWVILAWASCFLIFNLFADPLINTIDDRALTSLDLFHFTGYTLFTLGNGDFAPAPGPMQILSNLVSAYGMIILSLGISYVLGVIDGVVQKRSVAGEISALGGSSESILLTSFDGERFYDLSAYWNSLSSNLGQVTTRQKAYPLMNYYYVDNSEKSLSYMLPIMMDTLYVFQFGLSNDKGINQPFIKKSISAVEDYLSSSTTISSQEQEETNAPALPDYKMLQEAGLPLAAAEKFEQSFKEVSDTRKHLYLIVELQ